MNATSLVDIPREGGRNPTKIIAPRNGRRLRLDPDGTVMAINIRYDVTPVDDGHAVAIAAGDMKTIRQLLQRVKKDLIFRATGFGPHQ